MQTCEIPALLISGRAADGLCGRSVVSFQSGQQGRLGKQLLGWSSKAYALEASSWLYFGTLIWGGQNLANNFQTEFVIMNAKIFEMFFCFYDILVFTNNISIHIMSGKICLFIIKSNVFLNKNLTTLFQCEFQ